MMESLSIARFLTAEALEWMHIPGWWTRWQRHQNQGKEQGYYPSSHLYARLRFLVEQGWIYRIKRAAQYGITRFVPEPDLYGLLEEGALIVAGYQRRPIDTVGYDRKRTRSLFTLNHSGDIGTFYAALRARVERREGLHIADWYSEHLTAKHYDRISVRRQSARGDMETVILPVQPDATFVLEHAGGSERFFVEVDRGTRPLTTWVEKIQAYHAYTGSPELKARYGVDRFILLATTPTEAQQHAIMQATASVLRKPSARYLFALHPDIHPTTIATAWRKLASMTASSNSIRPTITTEAHTLIQ